MYPIDLLEYDIDRLIFVCGLMVWLNGVTLETKTFHKTYSNSLTLIEIDNLIYNENWKLASQNGLKCISNALLCCSIASAIVNQLFD